MQGLFSPATTRWFTDAFEAASPGRTITDRCLWKTARLCIRERNTLQGPASDRIRDRTRYLTDQLQAGSQADLARSQGSAGPP